MTNRIGQQETPFSAIFGMCTEMMKALNVITPVSVKASPDMVSSMQGLIRQIDEVVELGRSAGVPEVELREIANMREQIVASLPPLS